MMSQCPWTFLTDILRKNISKKYLLQSLSRYIVCVYLVNKQTIGLNSFALIQMSFDSEHSIELPWPFNDPYRGGAQGRTKLSLTGLRPPTIHRLQSSLSAFINRQFIKSTFNTLWYVFVFLNYQPIQSMINDTVSLLLTLKKTQIYTKLAKCKPDSNAEGCVYYIFENT